MAQKRAGTAEREREAVIWGRGRERVKRREKGRERSCVRRVARSAARRALVHEDAQEIARG